MAVKIYNKDGEYVTTTGILKKMSFKEEIELIKTLFPEYKDYKFKPIKKRDRRDYGRTDKHIWYDVWKI